MSFPIRKSTVKNADRFGSRPGRKMIVDGVAWKWEHVIRNIIMYSEKGDRKSVEPHVLLKMDRFEYDRACRKRTDNCSVTPEKILRYLRDDARWTREAKAAAKRIGVT